MKSDSARKISSIILSFVLFFSIIIPFNYTYAGDKSCKNASLEPCTGEYDCKNSDVKSRRRLVEKDMEEVTLDDECVPLGTVTIEDEKTPLGNVKKPSRADVQFCIKKNKCADKNDKKVYIKFIMDKKTIENMNPEYRGFYDIAFAISGGFFVIEEKK